MPAVRICHRHLTALVLLLGLLTIVHGDLRLTDLSRKLLAANIHQRKAIVRDIIDDVPVFR